MNSSPKNNYLGLVMVFLILCIIIYIFSNMSYAFHSSNYIDYLIPMTIACIASAIVGAIYSSAMYADYFAQLKNKHNTTVQNKVSRADWWKTGGDPPEFDFSFEDDNEEFV